MHSSEDLRDEIRRRRETDLSYLLLSDEEIADCIRKEEESRLIQIELDKKQKFILPGLPDDRCASLFDAQIKRLRKSECPEAILQMLRESRESVISAAARMDF